ncbi:hypothetical protein ABZX40_37855 [Streptomyces sp. NPDC004610]|uniref:hypothetical protein n=1 Tax=unclassified Streptomyces TaxID=2593676 RepID=UPI0033BAE632
MVAPHPPSLSPEQRQRLERVADEVRLRAALYPAPARRSSRQYPDGRSMQWRTVPGWRRR